MALKNRHTISIRVIMWQTHHNSWMKLWKFSQKNVIAMESFRLAVIQYIFSLYKCKHNEKPTKTQQRGKKTEWNVSYIHVNLFYKHFWFAHIAEKGRAYICYLNTRFRFYLSLYVCHCRDRNVFVLFFKMPWKLHLC